jgi:transcriptional regulator with XRE-family HTH domain
MCIGLKIKELMSKEKIDAPELARRLGKTKQAVYDMLEKENLNTSILRSLSTIFNVPVTFFFTDDCQDKVDSSLNVSGDITITGNNNSHIGHHIVNADVIETIEIECPKCGETIDIPDTAVIPLIPVEVAKAPDLNLESFRKNCPQEMQEVDLRQIWGNGVFLMRVDTRVMEPEYREGTFLVLKKLPDISFARADGSAYVVDTMRPHTLFRYLSKERDGSYTLKAEDDRRDPIYLQADDILNVYDIVGSFRIGR